MEDESSKRRRVSQTILILDLPNEILAEVLSFLPLPSQYSLALTCQRFHSIWSTPHVWKTTARSLVRIRGQLSDATACPLYDQEALLSFLFSRCNGNWKSVVQSFGKLKSFWAPLARLAHVLVSEEATCSSPLLSKYYGIPFVETGSLWPKCQYCENPLRFYVQFGTTIHDPLREAAKSWLGEDSLLQIFYCTCAECYEEDTMIPPVKILHHQSISSKQCLEINTLTSLHDKSPKFGPAKSITRFKTVLDFPNYGRSSEIVDGMWGELEGGDEEYEEPLAEGSFGDFVREHCSDEKLFGWVSGLIEPWAMTCETCGSHMVFLYEVGEGEMEKTYCDLCLHVFLCDKCHEIRAFSDMC